MRRPPLALTGLLLLAGCSAAPTSPEQPAPVDQELISGWRLARYAFEEGQYDQAAQMYARVLERAYARDDLGAIGDVGYELAVVRLRQLDPAAAAAQARRTRDELRRRGNEPFSELYLVEAVALYELDEEVDATVRAEEAIELAPGPAEPVALRAWFLKGRIAADNADAAGVSRALAAFGRSPNPELQADRLELTGRLELLEGRPERALPAFRESADLRRDAKDYLGMARVLALAGEAADRAGLSADAADLYFRAGRSAEVERDLVNARRWLGDAARLAETTGQAAILAEANDRLEGLAKAEGRQRIRPRVDQDPKSRRSRSSVPAIPEPASFISKRRWAAITRPTSQANRESSLRMALTGRPTGAWNSAYFVSGSGSLDVPARISSITRPGPAGTAR